MRKLPPAAVAALTAAALIAATLGFGSSHREAPGILEDPTADNTDVYAFTAPDAPDRLTVVANWIPLEDPAGGRTSASSTRRPATTSRSTTRATARGRRATAGSSSTQFRNPDSFLYAAAAVDSIDDPDLNFVQTYDLYEATLHATGKARPASADRRARRCRSRRTTSGPRRSRTTTRSPTGAITQLPRRRQVVRRPARRPVLRRPRRRRSTAINIDKPGRPTSASATRAAARTTSPATTCTRSCCRCPRRGHAATASRSPARRPSNAVVGVWASTERRRVQVAGPPASTRTGNDWVQVCRLGNPLDQRGHHPARPEGQVQPHAPGGRREELRPVRAEPGAGGVLNALFGLGVKEKDRTDIVQALLTGRPRPDADRQAPGRRPTRSSSTSACRRRRARTASASWRATPPASRTAAGSPTTSPTSSCA